MSPVVEIAEFTEVVHALDSHPPIDEISEFTLEQANALIDMIAGRCNANE
jgi:hypothetical protein